MSDPGKQEYIEDFLRRSLLGEELVNTQFHLFSARSSPSGRVLKPRVLCANNLLLAKNSQYFLDLLSSDINASDPSLTDLTGDHDVPDHAQIDDYGYGSDSDLDDCNDPIPTADTKTRKDRSGGVVRSKDDDALSDDGSDDGSDIFVMSPEQPRTDGPFSLSGAGSVASSETAIQATKDDKTFANQNAMRLRSLGSRHILIKDTAFQTWYTLLNYLYTDKFNFSPLSSATPDKQPRESSTSSLDEPRCSAKSMYRLACKVGLYRLRDEAFSYIRSNLTEHNILRELSCSLVSKHPQLLGMELDVLYSHIGSAPVIADFSALAKRIANKELPHGADIIVGIHTRLLKEPRPLHLKPPASSFLSNVPAPAERNVRNDMAPQEKVEWTGMTPAIRSQGISTSSSSALPEASAIIPNAYTSKESNNKGGMARPAPPPLKSALGSLKDTKPQAPRSPSMFASPPQPISVAPSTLSFASNCK